MKDKINSVKFTKPIYDIVSNVTSAPENNPENIKKLLVEQICSTVKMEREYNKYVFNSKLTTFIEIGPGKVLSNMVKRTVKDINCFSINSINDMKNIINEFKNKKVVITGATGGIGFNLVKKFTENGSNVLATGTKDEKLSDLKKFNEVHAVTI